MEGTAEPRRRRRWWLAPVIIAVLVGLYALAGFFGVPWAVRSIGTDQVAKLGRQLSIGEIRFNPFTFEATITGLRLAEADGAPLVAFDALYLDAMAWQSIVQRGFVLGAVRLTTPNVAVVVDQDGTVNFAKLAPPSNEPPSPPGPPPKIAIGDLAIEHGNVTLEDRSRPTPFKTALSPVDLHLQDFRTDAEHANGLHLKASATTGEQIEWSGDFTVQPFSSKGHIDLHGLKTSTLTSYLQDQLPVRLVSGVADLGADYHLVLQPSLDVELHVPEATVKDLALAEPKADHPPVAVGQITVRETTLALAQREVKIGSVAIDKPAVVVTRDADGTLNLARLVTAPKAAPSPAPKAAAAPPAPPTPAWRVSVGRIELSQGAINVTDRGVTPAVSTKIAGLKASVADFTLDPAAPLKVELSSAVGAKGRLATQGTIQREPLSGDLTLKLSDLDLALVQPYLQPHTGVALQSARLGVTGALAFAVPAGAPPTIDFTGDASLRDLAVVERATKRDLLTWSALDVAGIAYHHAQQSLVVERVDLAKPKARVEIAEDRQINVLEALQPPGAVKAPPPEAAPPQPTAPKKEPASKKDTAANAFSVKVKIFHIEHAKLDFSDRSIQPNFTAAIYALTGDITGISTDPSSRTKIQLAGKVDEFSPVLISGDTVPTAYDRHTDITMSFHNMDLVRFNPYSGKFAGYNIVKGKLTTDLHYTIDDRALTAEHHIVLDQLEFGDATGSKEAVPLPVKLAVALLKDRNGLIDLQLPINGSLDDPAFHIAPVIGKVVMNLVTKAVTAPFSLLASLFGGSGEELAFVDFAPGRTELRDSESGKMAKLAQALVERPQLKLDIPLALAAERDGAALAHDTLAQRTPGATDDERLKALTRTYQELLGTKPELAKDLDTAGRIAALEAGLVPKLMPDEQALRHLADERAHAVQASLLAHPDIAPERVFLTGEASSELSDGGDVRMKLSIKP